MAAPRFTLDPAALLVGYALSRLDRRLLSALAIPNWGEAFRLFGEALAVKPSSVKLLRDEFDPIHSNGRRGWADRPMNPSRIRIIEEFEDVSDIALIELVRGVLHGNAERTRETLKGSATTPSGTDPARRLQTGRAAEAWFLANVHEVLGHSPAVIRDARDDLRGFDFELTVAPRACIEVKGLSGSSGDLLFTDLEWITAGRLRDKYWLVVVASLDATPHARVVRDPASSLSPSCVIARSIRTQWHARFPGSKNG